MLRTLLPLAVCLAAGPCVELCVHVDVDVDPSGAARRSVYIETNDRANVEFIKPGARSAGTAAWTVESDLDWNALRGQNSKSQLTSGTTDGGKVICFDSVRQVEKGKQARDLQLIRRGESTGANNDARVTTEDFILFTKVVFRETIRDSATRDSMTAAAAVIASHFSEILKLTLRPHLEHAYDTKLLDQYLQKEFRSAFARCLVEAMEGVEGTPGGIRAFADALVQEGVPINETRLIAFFESPSNEADFIKDVKENLRDGLIRKVASLLRTPGPESSGGGREVPWNDLLSKYTDSALRETYATAFQRVLGTAPDMEVLFSSGGGRLFGSFGGVAFDPVLGACSVRWRTALRMPGQMIQTNGVPLRDGRILWLQLSRDLALRANVQEAVSICIHRDAIAAIGGISKVLDGDEALELLSTLGTGRERTPNRDLLAILNRAVSGETAALEEIHRDARLKPVVRIFEIPKPQ